MTRGQRNINWIERYCFIPEGKLVGQRVKLTQHQKNWIRAIYDTPTRTFILSIPRKNAKTALAAFLTLLHLAGPEAVRNGQLFSTAQSRDQAGLVFQLAAKIIRMSPDLKSYIAIRDTAKQLFCPELGTLYRALSAEASTAYGLSPVFCIHDELGQVIGPRSELYEAIETACAAQERPLSIIISTQAPTDADLLSILIDDALTAKDPKTKVILYSAPENADPFSIDTVRMANPHFDEFMNQDEVMSQAEKARRMPSKESQYRNLILNQRVNVSSPFVSKDIWDLGNQPIDEEAFEVSSVFQGIDLSIRSDLSARVAMAQSAHDGKWNVKCWFYTPENGLKERSEKDRTPYDLWVKQGHLIATPGATVDYDVVVADMKDEYERGNVSAIGYDRYRIDDFNAALTRAEMEFVTEPFGQGFVSMAPAIDSLESMLLNGRIHHGGHPVLKMCATNTVVVRDAAGNRKFDKSKATGKIDGMIALVMAAHLADKSTQDSFDPDAYEPIKAKT